MTRLMVPKSFDSVAIDGSAGIFSAAFELPSPRVLSKIGQVAGGEIFDFDYGEDADLQPRPFTVRFFLEGTSAANLSSLFTSMFASPTLGGKVGTTATFVARQHGTANDYECEAQMQTPQISLGGNFFGPSATDLSVTVEFVPTEFFTLVT